MRGLCDFSNVDRMTELTSITQHACQSLGGTIQTYLLSRIVLEKHVPGVFVECGVAGGAQLACMALAMVALEDRRVIHAYDSFQGIPLAGPKDEQQPGFVTGFLADRNLPLEERLKSSGVSACCLADVKRTFDAWKFRGGITVEYHEGWFQHTLPKNDLGQIAFLRLDGDLAESTEVCLSCLHDKVAAGGIVYVDDYELDGCKWAVHEFLEARRLMPELLRDEQGNSGAVYWIK